MFFWVVVLSPFAVVPFTYVLCRGEDNKLCRLQKVYSFYVPFMFAYDNKKECLSI